MSMAKILIIAVLVAKSPFKIFLSGEVWLRKEKHLDQLLLEKISRKVYCVLYSFKVSGIM